MTKINERFKGIVDLQDEFNSRINKDWRYEHPDDYDWGSCILCEGAEAIDTGTGFKHWTPLEVDMPNFEVETIDNLHFTMSLAMRCLSNVSVTRCMTDAHRFATLTHKNIKEENSRLLLKRLTKELTYYSLLVDRIDMGLIAGDEVRIGDAIYRMFGSLFKITSILGWSIEDIVNKYIVKNVLNTVRKENGYKTGEYVKMWNGEEDNVVAFRTIKELECKSEDTFKVLKSLLNTHYREHIAVKKQ